MDNRPRYLEELSRHFMGMQVEKKLIGKKFVRVARMLSVSAFLFETGAILGSVFRDRLYDFLIAFSAASEHKMVDLLQAESEQFTGLVKEVETIQQLFMAYAMRQQGVTAPANTCLQWLASKVEERMWPEDAFRMSQIYGSMGVGFWAYLPDSLADLYVGSYGNVDPSIWARGYKYGVVSEPAPPPFMPLAERQAEATSEYAEFCRENFPELVEKLSL